jgi:hypothetical protein
MKYFQSGALRDVAEQNPNNKPLLEAKLVLAFFNSITTDNYHVF